MTCYSFEGIFRDYNPERMAKSDFIHTPPDTVRFILMESCVFVHTRWGSVGPNRTEHSPYLKHEREQKKIKVLHHDHELQLSLQRD